MRAMKLSCLALAALAALALGGCGSSLDSGGDSTAGATGTYGTDPNGLRYVGAAACIECHKGFTWSSAAVSDYLAGKHVVHSTHVDQKLAQQAGCGQCHDPIGDGQSLEALIDPVNVPADGLAAVTCEACHGAGGQHYGVGSIPNPTPDYTTCGNCHAALPANHLVYHPEANNIITDYQSSGHNTGLDSHNSNVCSKCHTDEGARLYKNVDTVAGLEAVVLAVPSPSQPVQCRTCHNPHNPAELLEAATSTKSAEYATCTNCHQAHDAKVGTLKYTLIGSTSTDGASDPTEASATRGSLIYHASRWNRIITTTHYDDPATTAVIEGYTMSAANERACRDCHNVHSADITINEQWAKSAHGGEIMEAKEAAAAGNLRTIAEVNAVKAAGANDVAGSIGFAAGWVHYDWDSSSRQSCQRCHTATGLKNFLSAPTTYNAANNNFSHLVGWTNVGGVITSSGQNEMLYCWGCHANNSGALRNPGALTISYTGTPGVTPSDNTETYPDVAGSNVCVACHTGRETGNSIKLDTDADGTRSFINSHYLSAGGQLFATTGYEFADRNYNNVPFYAHDQIGTATEPGTGTNGPCVACHMTSAETHRFLPVEKDATGTITAVTATVCAGCHTAISAAEMNNWKGQYEAALAALQAAMDAKGIFFANAHPYFYNGAGATGGAYTTWAALYGLAGWKDTMGAAYNLNLLLHDPGGFAHNKYYVKGLIWDSIDYINDGVLNNDVPATLLTLGLDPATLTAAQGYLGTTRPGDTIRPGE